jgi:hypothetical protein
MDQRELIGDLQEGIRSAIRGDRATLWTALPGTVQSFNSAQMTVTVQPTIQMFVRESNGTGLWTSLPILRDVPVIFPCAGGFALTFPIAVGDEVLVIFASRCIDSWWQNSGVGVQAEFRMHDLSDGFAIPGPRSLPKVIASIAATAQLRSIDGTTYIELAGGQIVNIHAAGGLNITGNVVVTGTISASGDISSGTVTLDTHHHTGVTTGGGVTGGPVG